MRRREFMVAVGAAAVWPTSYSLAQSSRMRRIDVLMTTAPDADGTARIAAFRRRLERLGWSESKTVHVKVHWGAADIDRMRGMAREIALARPDVVLATSGRGLRLLQSETKDLPIVLVGSADPVQSGLVSSLARPSGNVTGFASVDASFAGKWLEILKEIAPKAKIVGFIISPDNPAAPAFQSSLQTAATKLGVQLKSEPVRDANDIGRALTSLSGEPSPGLVLPLDATLSVHQPLLAQLTSQLRLPTLSGYVPFTSQGGLISYGVDYLDLYERAATYVHRVLNGESPADLPVQSPTKYKLAVNLKTAQVMGLTVPATLLARADEVIE